MSDPTTTFHALRPRLQRIGYRMLGSRAEAEELVQDVWLRWHEAAPDVLDNAEAWLVTVTTRLAIDRLRSAQAQRAHYPGLWLPEPDVEAASHDTPERLLERADELSFAFLAVLERLAPEARAAFLMREVFDADYADVAATLGKTEVACRQLVRRAKLQLQEARPRYTVPPETHRRLLQDFASAASSGDFAALKSLLAEDAELIGDGGGKVPSFGRPLVGGTRIAQLFYATHRRHGDGVRIELAWVNDRWGLLRWVDGVLESVQAVETDGTRILRLHVQRNPDKLARIAAALVTGAPRDPS